MVILKGRIVLGNSIELDKTSGKNKARVTLAD